VAKKLSCQNPEALQERDYSCCYSTHTRLLAAAAVGAAIVLLLVAAVAAAVAMVA
jgi:hypothetical protein